MHKIVQAARDAGYLKDFPPVLDEAEAAEMPARNVLYLCTGSQGEPRAALARIADDSHPFVHLGKGDAVIFSSRIIPGNDLAIFELHNKLSILGVEVLTELDHFVHVSAIRRGTSWRRCIAGPGPASPCRCMARCGIWPSMHGWPSRCRCRKPWSLPTASFIAWRRARRTD